MKTILRIRWAALIFLAAFAAHAQTLTFSNTVVFPGGNPANVAPFDIQQFNPADGTLTSVVLTMDFSFQSLFTYNGASATGTLTLDQGNSISFLYNGSDVVAGKDYGTSVFNAGLPSTGYSSGSGIPIETNVIFSAASDLANFTGTGEIPLSAEYYNDATVTWTSGTVTWSLDDNATLTALVTYDFTPTPEPGVMSLLSFGALGFAVSKHRYLRKSNVRERRGCVRGKGATAAAAPNVATCYGSWRKFQ
jgi:hypothetical protein